MVDRGLFLKMEYAETCVQTYGNKKQSRERKNEEKRIIDGMR